MGMRRGTPSHRATPEIPPELRRTRLRRRRIRVHTRDKIINSRASLLCLLFALVDGTTVAAQDVKSPAPRRITLEEAVQLALKHNHVVRIAAYKVEEKERTKDIARSAYFPILRNDSNLAQVTDTQFIGIPAGTLGTVSGTTIPKRTTILNQGGHTFITSGTQLTQPLTDLWKIKPANDVAP